MRNLFILFFVLISFCATAQINVGKMTVVDKGSYYELKLNTVPVNNTYPYPDSSSLRVTVVCVAGYSYEVNFVPTNTVLKYRFKGPVIVSSAVIWWKNGVKMSQTCLQTLCVDGNKLTSCFEKI